MYQLLPIPSKYYLGISPLLLLFANPSLAFEINPDISLTMRFEDFWSSSLGLLKGLLSFCVKSLTLCSRFNCRNTFSSSFSFSFFHKKKVKSIFYKWEYLTLCQLVYHP